MNDDDTAQVAALVALQSLLVDAVSVEDFAEGVARAAARHVGPATSATITLRREGRPTLMSASDPAAAACDEVEYATGDGPCLEAIDTGRLVHVADVARETRWPRWQAATLAHGFGSAAALPRAVRPGVEIALNLYAPEPRAWTESALSIADVYADQVACGLTLFLRTADQAELNADLRAALVSRAVIDQAIGVIMAENRCTVGGRDVDPAQRIAAPQDQAARHGGGRRRGGRGEPPVRRRHLRRTRSSGGPGAPRLTSEPPVGRLDRQTVARDRTRRRAWDRRPSRGARTSRQSSSRAPAARLGPMRTATRQKARDQVSPDHGGSPRAPVRARTPCKRGHHDRPVRTYLPPDRRDAAPRRAPTTAQTAKDESAHLKDKAADAGGHLVDEAKGRGSRSHPGGTSPARRPLVAGTIRALRPGRQPAEPARLRPHLGGRPAHADGRRHRPSRTWPPTSCARSATGSTRSAAGSRSHGPDDVLDEVRSFARRRPGTFLAPRRGGGRGARSPDPRAQGRAEQLREHPDDRLPTRVGGRRRTEPLPVYDDAVEQRPRFTDELASPVPGASATTSWEQR